MDAARSRNAVAVKLLIEKGADVNARTKRNSKAIAYAASFGAAGAVIPLLDNGARLDILDERNLRRRSAGILSGARAAAQSFVGLPL